jgi:hypothetical protein
MARVGLVIENSHEVAKTLGQLPSHVQAKIIGDDVEASSNVKKCGQSTPSFVLQGHWGPCCYDGIDLHVEGTFTHHRRQSIWVGLSFLFNYAGGRNEVKSPP